MLNPHVFLVTAGTESFDYLDGASESYSAGQTAEMYVNRPGNMSNQGTVTAAYVITTVQYVPGTPGSGPVPSSGAATAPQISPPNTGDAGLLASSAGDVRPWAVVMVLGVLAVGATALLVRPRTSRSR